MNEEMNDEMMASDAAAAAAAATATAAAAEKPPAPLPRLRIDPSSISVSGLSSGADFAAQFQVAYSKTVTGVGVFAGQPFHCAATCALSLSLSNATYL